MPASRAITMLIVGDVSVNRDDPPSVFQYVRDTMRRADIMIGNLEGPYADGGTPWPKGGVAVWRANARQIAAIEAGGFHAMGVTNNHIMDFGYEGLFETVGHLDRLGIAHAGAGHNRAEAHAPAIVTRDGCRVAMLAYTSVFTPGWEAGDDTPGLAVMAASTAFQPHPRHNETPGKPPLVRTWVLPASREQLAKDVAAARAQADIVLCSFHWGVSAGYIALTDYQVELGHHAVDVGADLVFGHHPHALQGVEIYRGKPIFYSLGNFTFARHKGELGHELETCFLRCHIADKRIIDVEYLPVRCDERINPHLLSLAEGRKVIDIIERRSAAFGTKFEAAGDAMRVVGAAGFEPTTPSPPD